MRIDFQLNDNTITNYIKKCQTQISSTAHLAMMAHYAIESSLPQVS